MKPERYSKNNEIHSNMNDKKIIHIYYQNYYEKCAQNKTKYSIQNRICTFLIYYYVYEYVSSQNESYDLRPAITCNSICNKEWKHMKI